MLNFCDFIQVYVFTTNHHLNKLEISLSQKCKTRMWYIQYILYYKVYNSSCSQVGHDLIDRVKSSPDQIKITVSICKYILCDD